MEARPGKDFWTAVVVTTRTASEAQAIATELVLYQKKNIISSETVIFTIEDPSSQNGSSVGSGGATINALLYAVEQLCARRGYQILSPDVLADSRILIIHHGRPYPFGGFSRGFCLLPRPEINTGGYAELCSNILHLYTVVTEKMLPVFGSGLWVCSSDMLLDYQPWSELCWKNSGAKSPDACIITVPSEPEYATQHGIVLENSQGVVEDILYMATLSKLQSVAAADGSVSLVSGIVYLSVEAAEKLLALQSYPVLECCTYMGVDVGSHPRPISLYFDILLAMCSRMSDKDFMGRGSTISRMDSRERGDADHDAALRVRHLIWEHMRSFTLTAVCLQEAKHFYLSIPLCLQDHVATLKDIRTSSNIHSFTDGSGDLEGTFINSLLTGSYASLTSGTAVNSYVNDSIRLSPDTFLCNLDTRESYFGEAELVTIPGLCYQVVQVALQRQGMTTVPVSIVYGTNDILMAPVDLGSGTYCGVKWRDFLRSSGISEFDLWPTASVRRTLWNARLFPVLDSSGDASISGLFWAFDNVRHGQQQLDAWRSSWRFSLEQIFDQVDLSAEFRHRRKLFYEVFLRKLTAALMAGVDFYALPYMNSAVEDGFAEMLLSSLDSVAASAPMGVAARTLALTADMLGCMARGHGGLRSGPAANSAFSRAFRSFEKGDVSSGVLLMSRERKNWLGRPDLMIRCARHYEGAEQICIRQAVSSAKQFISLKGTSTVEENLGLWHIAECGARIDLSGGWTDTPPIAYEKGGMVVNAALLINGKRPIGAKVRRISQPKISLLSVDVDLGGGGCELTDLSDLHDFCIPNAPGALLKACIIFADIVSLSLEVTLEEQLRTRWKGGLEISTWSDLPQGSGLGTSSILAAAIISALWSATSRIFDNTAVIHAVLCIEQMLTTGGGWQDQVGGVYGGFKLGSSAAALPLEVKVDCLSHNAVFIEDFNSRILLIYTGKPRLAKNLLQNVVRNWYAREEDVVAACSGLKTNAEKCWLALQKKDFHTVCDCITTYFEQKKLMAAGTEPASVRKIIDELEPFVCCHTLAGAGGGGFLFCLLKDPRDREIVSAILHEIEGVKGAAVFSAVVDTEGMKLTTSA